MYKMLVESADWKELQDSVAAKDRIIEDMKKQIRQMLKDLTETGTVNVKEAEKYL